MIECFLTCHSLSIMDGQLQGDPIDLNMFIATGGIYEEPAFSTKELAKILWKSKDIRLIKRYDFVAEL